MSRVAVPTREAAPAAAQPFLDGVEKQLGVVPNLFRLAALSPAVLQGMLGLSGALARTLDVKTRERIALVVAQVNGCDYCLSAHTYLGLNLAKLDAGEIALNRKGDSTDPRAAAVVAFAAKVAQSRGKVADSDLADVRLAGITDAQVVEIVALVAENFLTNLLNNVARTPIDFPVVLAADLAQAA
ncbi:carboxymuconolactone decarboxylase family protein [soil metagenome]